MLDNIYDTLSLFLDFICTLSLITNISLISRIPLLILDHPVSRRFRTYTPLGRPLKLQQWRLIHLVSREMGCRSLLVPSFECKYSTTEGRIIKWTRPDHLKWLMSKRVRYSIHWVAPRAEGWLIIIVCRVSQRKFPVLDSFPGLCQVSLVDCFREAFLLYQVGDNDNAIIRPVWYAIFALTIWPLFQSASFLVLYLPCCPFAVRSKLAPWQSGENTHETTPLFFLSLAAHAERIFSHQSWSYRFSTRLLSGHQARSLRAPF